LMVIEAMCYRKHSIPELDYQTKKAHA
jgi:hypothetical protein